MRIQQGGVESNGRGRGRWVVALIVMLLMLLGVLSWLLTKTMGASLGGFGPAQMAAAQYTARDVVGDLGGMPVTIPRHMAEFVEYEGDPGWGEKRQSATPERTYQSHLTSFGVQFRYADLATLSSSKEWKDKKSKSIYNTDWMSFGITSGKQYPGNGWLDRLTDARLLRRTSDRYIYIKQPQRNFGLDAYFMVNKDTGQPDARMPTVTGESLYIGRDDNNQVTTYIECSMAPHAAAPCAHSFSMEFQGVNAKVYVGYRRPMLEHWQDIQEKVTAIILGFKAEPISISAPAR